MDQSSVGVFGKTLSKEDFERICRICLSPDPSGSVFELTHEEIPLVDVFCTLFGTQLDAEDDLPKQICETCIGEVIRCYTFRKRYESSEATLQNLTIKTEHVDAKIEIKLEPLREDFEELVETQFNEKVTTDSGENKTGNKTEENFEVPVDLNKLKQSKKLTCSCEETFSTKLEFRQHREVTNHRIPRTDPCKICGKLFSKRGLGKHLKIHEDVKPYGCDQCDAGFTTRGNLQRHMLIHTGGKPHVCDICGKGFIELRNMQDHRRIHTGEKPYVCAVCGSAFRNKARFNIHMRDHRPLADCTTKFVCEKCGRMCRGQRAFKRHVYRHGLGKGQVVEGDHHQCGICKKFYASQGSLTCHKRSHNEKNFLCNECGKVFHTKSALESHYLSHTGAKPFACDLCDKKFARQAGLQKHRFVHTGEKPFACTLCPKKFRQGTHLTCHLTVHTGERPYVCKFCDKSYAYKGSLNIHLRMHAGEKPYKCDMCTSTFYDSGSLNKHKQRKHRLI